MRLLAKAMRWVVLCAVVFAPVAATVGIAHAAANGQEGDNRSTTDQSGSGTSGDSVAGQVAGVVSAGSASVDATNSTDHSDASSGDARGTNDASTITGQNAISGCSSLIVDACTADLSSVSTVNGQEGDNVSRTNQDATTTSGAAVAGGVVGVVTSAGGSADVVLGNGTSFSDVASGDSRFSNNANTIVGQELTGGPCCALPDTLGLVATPGLQS